MAVLTSKLRASLRRVVQGQGLSYQQLRALYYRAIIHDYAMALVHWPVYQRECYLRGLIQ